MAVTARANPNGPHTNIFMNQLFIGSWCVSHQLAIELYDPFDESAPTIEVPVQEIDWERFIPYGCPTLERKRNCCY